MLQRFLAFIVMRAIARDFVRESRRMRKAPSHGLRVVIFGNEKIFMDNRRKASATRLGGRFERIAAGRVVISGVPIEGAAQAGTYAKWRAAVRLGRS